MRNRFLLTSSLLTALVLTIAPPLSAQEDEPARPDVPAWQMNFENLPPEDRQRYAELMMRASTLFNQKRIFEALNAANDAAAIFDSDPACMNLKGACYVEFRDFPTARDLFLKALALTPDNTSVLFNLAEMDFVTGQWEECHRRMGELLEVINPKAIDMRRLVEFKLLLAKLKTNRVDEARELAGKYDFLDDTPFHYYASAALEYHDGDRTKAERWLGSARRVFRTPETLAPWQDTLIEFGYIKSFYGGDLGDDVPDLP